jgi:hypothetical protein
MGLLDDDRLLADHESAPIEKPVDLSTKRRAATPLPGDFLCADPIIAIPTSDGGLIDVGQLLPVVIADNETRGLFPNGLRRREAAGGNSIRLY